MTVAWDYLAHSTSLRTHRRLTACEPDLTPVAEGHKGAIIMGTQTPEERLNTSITNLNLQTTSTEYQQALANNQGMKAQVKASATEALLADKDHMAITKRNMIAQARLRLSVQTAIADEQAEHTLQAQVAKARAINKLTQTDLLEMDKAKATLNPPKDKDTVDQITAGNNGKGNGKSNGKGKGKQSIIDLPISS
jgi:hypothetical protein